VLALAGCDRLTISPELLAELERSDAPVTRALDETVQRLAPPAALDEAGFRARHDEDTMAREKLEEGIRKFAADQQQLEALLAAKLG
jgi:transaldolase